jgi:hypothetical protein
LYEATFLSSYKTGRVKTKYSTGGSMVQIRDLIVLVETSSVAVDFVGSRRYGNDLLRILSNLRLYPAFCAYIREAPRACWHLDWDP